jgi:hypothetical protein
VAAEHDVDFLRHRSGLGPDPDAHRSLTDVEPVLRDPTSLHWPFVRPGVVSRANVFIDRLSGVASFAGSALADSRRRRTAVPVASDQSARCEPAAWGLMGLRWCCDHRPSARRTANQRQGPYHDLLRVRPSRQPT